jgi:hypothetical protein
MTRAPEPFTADAVEAEESLRRLSLLAPKRMLFSHGPEVPDPVGELRRLLHSAHGVIFRSRLHSGPCVFGVVQASVERWFFRTPLH